MRIGRWGRAAVVCVAMPMLGCNLFRQDGSGNEDRFDGNWQVTNTKTAAQSCIVVSGNEVTRYEDACGSPPKPLKNVKPGVVSADRVVWAFTAVFPGQGNLEMDFVHDVTLQPDGTLAGNETSTIKPPGGPIGTATTNPVIMTPN